MVVVGVNGAVGVAVDVVVATDFAVTAGGTVSVAVARKDHVMAPIAAVNSKAPAVRHSRLVRWGPRRRSLIDPTILAQP